MDKLRCQIRENSIIAKCAAWKLKSGQVAIVFGSTIYLYGVSRERFLANTPWVRHEVCHIKQYREYGWWGFLARYVADWIRSGYYNNRFEQEARRAERDPSIMADVEIR